MTRTVESRETSARPQNFTHLPHLECTSFFVSLQDLHIAMEYFYAHELRESDSPRKRGVPRGTVCFPAICRTVNSERVACMARALLQDGNASWPNAEGGRRTSTESRESKLNSRMVVRGQAIPEKGYLTGGWWPPGESTDLPRTAPCGSWRTIDIASYGISEIPIARPRLCTYDTLVTKFVTGSNWSRFVNSSFDVLTPNVIIISVINRIRDIIKNIPYSSKYNFRYLFGINIKFVSIANVYITFYFWL